MNASQIAEFIKTPSTIQSSNLEELKQLTEQFPYTQVFSILYLKGLSTSGSVNFEKELQHHSFRIGDRQQLYYLINDHSLSPKHEEIIDESKQVKTIGVTVTEDSIIKQSNVDSTTEELVDEVLNGEEIEQKIVQLDVTANETHIDEKEEPEVIIDPLERTILEHAISSNYVLEDLSEEELIKLEEREQDKQTSQVVAEEISETIKPVVHIEGKQSFTSWINSNANNSAEDKEDEKAIRAIVNDFSEFDPSEKLFGEVEKPKKEFFSPIKKARESLNEEALPVSETLAKIYALQGNYPKAIDAYQQLSLKYPEKKVFFAVLISDLEKKLNNK